MNNINLNLNARRNGGYYAAASGGNGRSSAIGVTVRSASRSNDRSSASGAAVRSAAGGVDRVSGRAARISSLSEEKSSQQMRLQISDAGTGASASLPISTDTAGKKELDYDFKGMSEQIMRAKTPASVRMLAGQLQAKISDLNQKLNSSEYDTEEVTSAILHAEALMQAALKRANNLQMEADAKRKAKGGEALSSPAAVEEQNASIEEQIKENLQKELDDTMKDLMEEMQEEMKKLMEESGEEDSAYDALDELAKAMSGDMSIEDIDAMKKRHRSEELIDLSKADMDYLKAKFERLQAKRNLVNSGAFLNAGGIAMNAKTFADTIQQVSAVLHVSASPGDGGFAPPEISAGTVFDASG